MWRRFWKMADVFDGYSCRSTSDAHDASAAKGLRFPGVFMAGLEEDFAARRVFDSAT